MERLCNRFCLMMSVHTSVNTNAYVDSEEGRCAAKQRSGADAKYQNDGASQRSAQQSAPLPSFMTSDSATVLKLIS